MRRGSVERRRIAISRRATFGKRCAGLLKKARELAVLCDADLGVLVFDGAGRQFDYCSPHTSWTELIQRYDNATNDQLQGTEGLNHDHDQLLAEIARLRRERDHLEAVVRSQTGEDPPSAASAAELGHLEQKLECALGKVREMKDKLLEEELDESHHRVHILEDQNGFLRHMDKLLNQQFEDSRHKVRILEEKNSLICHVMNHDKRRRAAEEVAAELMPPPMMLPATAFGGFFPEAATEELSTSLLLWPHQLPDVQRIPACAMVINVIEAERSLTES